MGGGGLLHEYPLAGCDFLGAPSVDRLPGPRRKEGSGRLLLCALLWSLTKPGKPCRPVAQLALSFCLDLVFSFVVRDAENEYVFHLVRFALPTWCFPGIHQADRCKSPWKRHPFPLAGRGEGGGKAVFTARVHLFKCHFQSTDSSFLLKSLMGTQGCDFNVTWNRDHGNILSCMGTFWER